MLFVCLHHLGLQVIFYEIKHLTWLSLFGMGIVQVGIQTSLFDQLRIRSAFDHLSSIHNQDQIGGLDCTQAVSKDNAGPPDHFQGTFRIFTCFCARSRWSTSKVTSGKLNR
jgi:hypothetical protein